MHSCFLTHSVTIYRTTSSCHLEYNSWEIHSLVCSCWEIFEVIYMCLMPNSFNDLQGYNWNEELLQFGIGGNKSWLYLEKIIISYYGNLIGGFHNNCWSDSDERCWWVGSGNWETIVFCLHLVMAPHSSTFAWKIPWTEEPGRLQSMGSLRVGHHWATSLSLFTFMHWRRKWQPTPVFLPGESQERASLVGCRLWGRTESNTTEAT